jgi:protein TonB
MRNIPQLTIDWNRISLGHTLLAATLLHAIGILILNFDFSPGDTSIDTKLEITVVRPNPDAEEPEIADFLATASQVGSGNTQEREKPTQSNAMEAPFEIQTDIINKAEYAPPQVNEMARSDDTPIMTVSNPQPDQMNQQPDKNQLTEKQQTPAQLLANTQTRIERLTAELDEKTRAYAKIPRRGFISASTRAHIYAEYMEQWRRKIERTGKLYYPVGASGKVLVIVTVAADGTLRDVHIQEPSKSSVINDAALEIARLSSPFPPFNAELKKKHDELVISRTWYFLDDGSLETRIN